MIWQGQKKGLQPLPPDLTRPKELKGPTLILIQKQCELPNSKMECVLIPLTL